MNVLAITGDKNFGPGQKRYELQRAAVERFETVYWGRGAMWPRLPQGKFGVVSAQDPFLRGLFGLYAARKLGAKLNVQVHTDLSAEPFWKRLLAGFVLRRAHSVRVVSQKIKEQVERIGVRTKITVLPVFVELREFSSVARRPHSSKNVLWIGRFEAEKNPLEALRIFKEVLKVVPDARLTMLGEGSMRQSAIAQANGLHVVEIKGWQNPLVFLETADAVLCTSWTESWGASIVEALAAGVPVVAPDVGVAQEAGATVVPRAELAQALIDALRTPKHAELKLKLLSAGEWQQRWRESLGG